MSNLNSRRVNSTDTDDETSSLNGHAMTDVNSADNSPDTPVMSEEVARQMIAATGPLSKQLELCVIYLNICNKALSDVVKKLLVQHKAHREAPTQCLTVRLSGNTVAPAWSQKYMRTQVKFMSLRLSQVAHVKTSWDILSVFQKVPRLRSRISSAAVAN